MAGFGGSVKLTGESEYKQALKQITQNLKEVASEMKVVNSAYEADDRSMAAVNARTEALNKTLGEQEKKLAILQKQYESMSGEYAENTNRHNQLVASYEKEKAKLDEIGRTLGTSSKEYNHGIVNIHILLLNRKRRKAKFNVAESIPIQI